ncbi:anaphase-promoting complex subunit 11 [Quercus suber]|uniref:Anaphase-promoting complex subunit 11 n=1 Tax=Quercus suber TaxID=58331 RepID=A0AAW0KBB1_QUESU
MVDNCWASMIIEFPGLWHAVASWTWDAQDETCGICRMAFDGCCPDCKLPGDDCPLNNYHGLRYGRAAVVDTPFRALHKLMESVSKVTSLNPISSVHSTANSIAFASTLSADSGAGIFLLMAANAITCSQLLQITSPMPDAYLVTTQLGYFYKFPQFGQFQKYGKDIWKEKNG